MFGEDKSCTDQVCKAVKDFLGKKESEGVVSFYFVCLS